MNGVSRAILPCAVIETPLFVLCSISSGLNNVEAGLHLGYRDYLPDVQLDCSEIGLRVRGRSQLNLEGREDRCEGGNTLDDSKVHFDILRAGITWITLRRMVVSLAFEGIMHV